MTVAVLLAGIVGAPPAPADPPPDPPGRTLGVDAHGKAIREGARQIDHADAVVRGTVQKVAFVAGTAGYPTNKIVTVNGKTLKGKGTGPGGSFDVVVRGHGEGDDFQHGSEEADLPDVGEDVLLFLSASVDKKVYEPLLGDMSVIPAVLENEGGGDRVNPRYSEDVTVVTADCQPGPGEPPNPTGFSGFEPLGNTWVDGTTIVYSMAFSVPSHFYDELDTAMSAWTNANGRLSMQRGPLDLVRTGTSGDGVSVISFEYHDQDWRDPNNPNKPPSLARATTYSSGRSVDSDIVFNTYYSWAEGNTSNGGHNTVYVAMHEMGHSLGLGHVTDSAQVMIGTYCAQTGGSNANLNWGDRAGKVNRYPPNNIGYYLVQENGAVYALGGASSSTPNAPYYGGANINNVLGYPTNKSVDVEVYRPNMAGYWQLASNGGVFAWGSAPFKGSAAGLLCGGCTAVAMASTSTGNGYWILGSDGGIFAFGDAPFRGSAAGIMPGGTYAVGIAGAPNNNGYWVINNLGQMYAFNVPYRGGTLPSQSQPARGIEAATNGDGYWMLGNDGGIFAYNAPFYGGSAPGTPGVRNLSRHPFADMYQWVNNSGGIYQSWNNTHVGVGTGSTTWATTTMTIRPGTQPPPPPPPPAPNYSVYSSPSTISVARGSSGTSGLTASANSTFSGTVGWSTGGAPSGVSVSVNPGSVSLSASTSQTVTMTVSVPTTYTGPTSFVINASSCSGSMCRSTSVTVNVPLL